jgi:hypothetical protein
MLLAIHPLGFTRKRSPTSTLRGGEHLLPLIGMSGLFGFTRSPLAGRVDLPAKVLHESETGSPVKDEARHHIVAACTGCYGIFLDCVCDGLVEALQCALSHIRHTLVRIPNCSLFKDQAAFLVAFHSTFTCVAVFVTRCEISRARY